MTGSKSRPWNTVIRPPTPTVIVAGDPQPLAQITIYDHLVLLTRRTSTGWRQYAIDPAALAQTFAGVPVSSGLLPAHTLGAGTLHGRPFLVVWLPPRRVTLRTPYADYAIPLPPLVWAGWRQDYRIFALGDAAYPTRTDLPLFVAPFPNTYRDGGICWGDADGRPDAAPSSLAAALDLFLTGSLFNMHVANGKSVAYPVSVLTRWADLVSSQAEAYPLDDLIPAESSLAWVLSGRAWGGAQL